MMVSPISYIYYSVKAMELMADGKFTNEALAKLQQEQIELLNTLKGFNTK